MEKCLTLDEVLKALNNFKTEHGGKIRVYREDIKEPDMPISSLSFKVAGHKKGIYLPKRIVIEG